MKQDESIKRYLDALETPCNNVQGKAPVYDPDTVKWLICRLVDGAVVCPLWTGKND